MHNISKAQKTPGVWREQKYPRSSFILRIIYTALERKTIRYSVAHDCIPQKHLDCVIMNKI